MISRVAIPPSSRFFFSLSYHSRYEKNLFISKTKLEIETSLALMFIWRSYKSGHTVAKPTDTSNIITQRLEIIFHIAVVELSVVGFYVTYHSFL
jgi:hypothetical protein